MPTSARDGRDLFLTSLLILFLELACIRWFAAQVLFLTFFANTVLIACFLGVSAGCLAARARTDWLARTPAFLCVALAAGQLVRRVVATRWLMVAVEPRAPEAVFFGGEMGPRDAAAVFVGVEWVAAAFFLLLALTFYGLGQSLGRGFQRSPRRLVSYVVNLAGSLAGVALFAACSWLELSPLWWFAFAAAILVALLRQTAPLGRATQWGLLALAVVLASVDLGPDRGSAAAQRFWSPYYRIDYRPPPDGSIAANLILHQAMIPRAAPFSGYAIPHLLNRDSGRPPFADVLVIGAGSGNDVSRALEWGARHVDAVEIDPVILRIGREHHPDAPYADPRVTVHVDDGRDFLRSTDRRYDLVVYALVDSLVLHSGMSNIRLESHLFTREALADVQRHLKPGGVFVTYNYFRQGWVALRLADTLRDVFGAAPIVLTLPGRDAIRSEEPFWAFTVLVAGQTDALAHAFATHPSYALPTGVAATTASPDGFRGPGAGDRIAPVEIVPPATPLAPATDDWPFLYLKRPMLPPLTLRGVALMALVALALLAPSVRGLGGDGRTNAVLFLLGAGFMLTETRAVVGMALLFGSTWTVNAIVLAGVLVAALASTVLALRARLAAISWWGPGLVAALVVGVVAAPSVLLGFPPALRGLLACLLFVGPLFFAGVVFAVCFARAAEPERGLGANIAGAIAGGFLENLSMLVGFRGVGVLALALYGAALVLARRNGPMAVR